MSANNNMLTALSADQIAHMASQQYRRLELNRKHAKRYYETNGVRVKQRRLLARILNGACPSMKTIKRLGVEQQELIDAMQAYMRLHPNEEIRKRARLLQLRLIGTDEMLFTSK